jgi:hypothetical protein
LVDQSSQGAAAADGTAAAGGRGAAEILSREKLMTGPPIL